MKVKKNRKLNISAVFLTLCLVVTQLFLPVRAEADERIDTDAHTMIEINYIHGDEVLPGVGFNLYRVADVSETGEYTLVDPFDRTRAAVYAADSDQMRQTAEEITSFVKGNDIEPMMAGNTDSNGKLYFPLGNEHMHTGLYLITGQQFEYNGYIYEVEPMLVQLPSKIEGSDGWQYSVKIQPKSAKYIEGDVPGEVTENEDEKITDGKLPQTGQLWWPVPVLLAAGMMLIIIGLLRGRRADHDR